MIKNNRKNKLLASWFLVSVHIRRLRSDGSDVLCTIALVRRYVLTFTAAVAASGLPFVSARAHPYQHSPPPLAGSWGDVG